MTRSRRSVAGLSGATLALFAGALLAAPADAALIDQGEDSFEFHDTINRYCGVNGLKVTSDGTFTTSFTAGTKGKDGLVYFAEHIDIVNTITNPKTGLSATIFESTTSKDLDVIDNGDGTLTIVILATGSSSVTGPDGTVIARNPGQFRFSILIDDGGTPSDPSDDEFITDLDVLKESTGRTDDYCAAIVDAIT